MRVSDGKEREKEHKNIQRNNSWKLSKFDLKKNSNVYIQDFQWIPVGSTWKNHSQKYHIKKYPQRKKNIKGTLIRLNLTVYQNGGGGWEGTLIIYSK